MSSLEYNTLGDDVRVWWAGERDIPFALYLMKRFRNNEFFYAPDYVIEREIRWRNILCFDYRMLEAGYIWVTMPPNGRARINQLAVDEQLWRNKVGTDVIAFFESEVLAVGGWAIYLSCNSRTPGHSFWPTVGFNIIIEKPAGRRGGVNAIWAKLLSTRSFLLPPTIHEVKSHYKFQSSISDSKRPRILTAPPPSLFDERAA